MDQSGQLNGLDKFHLAFQQVWKSKNEFQMCWNGFDIDRREVEPKRSENSILELLYRYKSDGCTGEEGEEEEEEEEEKDHLGGLGASPSSHFLTLVASSLRLKLCGDPTSTLLGFELGLEHPRGSLPTSRHSGDSHRDSHSPCGIGRRSGLPWGRLIPRVGMMTTTGPLGSAPARQPTGGSQGIDSFGWVSSDLTLSIHYDMWTDDDLVFYLDID
uniref:Uncharacterized protein n=1 Tax=Ananas comosus var. bracteatus TaxID=296719 RepID=A0A6V7NTP6_ANACO|nr:unnamed protein product [Ananas comosus var. bracteatus]